ncbi:LacI family DNA-binding transcriptional regulator [Metabacillus sp. Hm71]|uniref:LacI family DNA-binding transcriptional regulator n=1 Tax=Metabacillus sp. Hm71 TaxID=3450743 RepID=UPI003F4249A1
MKSTIKEVAKKAGVSISTVSRVLNNNQKGYSRETKEKVLKAIAELQFSPNAIARGLVRKKTQTIAVIMPELSSLFSTKVLHGIEETANELQYSVIICNASLNGERTLRYVEFLKEKQVDGIIILSQKLTEEVHQELEKTDIPVILVSSISEEFPYPFVKVDDYQAAYDATCYLINKGHTSIAMISGTFKDVIAGKPRLKGYQQALADHGIELNDELIEFGNFSYKSGSDCMEVLLNKNSKFTAVFAASDEMAVGALNKAHQFGINVPEQLSIIGYDNTQLAEMSFPRLTTLSQSLEQMGEIAVCHLVAIIKDEPFNQTFILPHSIIERETVKSLC